MKPCICLLQGGMAQEGDLSVPEPVTAPDEHEHAIFLIFYVEMCSLYTPTHFAILLIGFLI